MWTSDQKVFIIKRFYETKSVATVICDFAKEFKLKGRGKAVLKRNAVERLVKKFETKLTLKDEPRSGVAYQTGKNQKIQVLKEKIKTDPAITVRRCRAETGYSVGIVHRYLKSELKLHSYKLQLYHKMKPEDFGKRVQYATACLAKEPDFLKKVVFSDEATFHLCGKVSKHNARIWGTERPTTFLEHERNSPKINVLCGLSCEKVYGPIFFDNDTIKHPEYLEILQNTLLPQLDGDYVFQQDGAPPHWALDVRTYLNQQLPGRWIGRAAERDQTMMKWPPRSPDLTPLDFYFWGYVKGKVYVPPLAQTIDQLKIRIRAAIQTVTIDVLIKVWANMARRLQKVIRTKADTSRT